MAAEDIYICYTMYFSARRTKFWVQPYWDFSIKYASKLSREVTHFAPDRYDNKSWRCKVYRYIKRNHKYLLGKGVDQALRTLAFYSLGDDGDFVMSPWFTSLSNSQSDRLYGTVFMHCQENIFVKVHKDIDFFLHFIEDLNSLVKIEYGLIHLMEGKKYPGLYFGDLPASGYLSKEENHNAKTWEKEGHRFRTIVRDIYWGNVLSKSHWGNDKHKQDYLVARLKNECGDNVFWIDKDTIFFCAPFDISQCVTNQSKFRKFQRNIGSIFADIGTKLLV